LADAELDGAALLEALGEMLAKPAASLLPGSPDPPIVAEPAPCEASADALPDVELSRTTP
jgi:hypothetical protein